MSKSSVPTLVARPTLGIALLRLFGLQITDHRLLQARLRRIHQLHRHGIPCQELLLLDLLLLTLHGTSRSNADATRKADRVFRMHLPSR